VETICADENVRGVLVIQEDRETYYQPGDRIEYFFHPNLAKMRVRNITKGGNDHLVGAMRLGPGDEVLDCTLGFASESIICAHVVGETGRVVGLESSPVLAYLAIEGLQRREFVSPRFTALMRRIEARQADYNEYLRDCEADTFDAVYFDPIFDEPLQKSESMAPLRALADKSPVSREAIDEAARVARRCVVIKQRQGTPLWEQFGITEVHGGKNSRVEYGVIPPG